MIMPKDAKWSYWKVTKDVYSILPPQNIRAKCGLSFEKTFGHEYFDFLETLNVYPIFDSDGYLDYCLTTETDARLIVTWLNREWKKKIIARMTKND